MDGSKRATSHTRWRVRQKRRCTLRRNASDTGHGGVSGGQLRVRNNIAHPLVPPTPTGVDQSGGEPERGGAVKMTTMSSSIELRSESFKRVPSD